MIHAQNEKTVVLIGPGTAATNATASARVDTLGFRYATFDIFAKATATDSSAKWTVLKLSEADTTTYSTNGDIATFTGTTNTVTSTSAGFVLQTNNDTTGQPTRLHVDLKGRKRYLFVVTQPGANGNTIFAQCRLGRGEEAPNTDTERGVAVSMIG